MRACDTKGTNGCPVACLGDAPFGYVNVFHSHVNVGFFHGAALPDPARLLQGTGKFMRHVKLTPGTATDTAALSRLIDAAYSDVKAARLSNTDGQRLQDGCLNTEIRRARSVPGRNSCVQAQRQLTQLCLCGEIPRFLHLSAARPGRHLRTRWPCHTRRP